MYITSTTLIQFQPATRSEIVTALEAIQAEWAALGIDTPVIDDMGDIDPDARIELAERL